MVESLNPSTNFSSLNIGFPTISLEMPFNLVISLSTKELKVMVEIQCLQNI